jgi:hypothetical protein
MEVFYAHLCNFGGAKDGNLRDKRGQDIVFRWLELLVTIVAGPVVRSR